MLVALLLCALAAALRFERLGARSLWLDEFSTWHVSRMELGKSLRWGPERTIAPLYQLCLRVLTDNPHPPEWLLRAPAAVAGTLTVLAAWWLGNRLGGPTTAAALALLLACDQVQIRYSQEARPYSLLVLGSTLSVLLWHRLCAHPTPKLAATYATVTTLTVYAHVLAVFAVLGQVGWSVRRNLTRRDWRGVKLRLVALAATCLLCGPLALRILEARSQVGTALAWIERPTGIEALAVLADVAFGDAWVLLVLLPSVLLWAGWRFGLQWPGGADAEQPVKDDEKNSGEFMLWWLGATWLGLFLVSLSVTPLMVPRYALPAAVPAGLFPLLVVRRFHRRAPLILAALVVVLSLPGLRESRETPLGFRELAVFLSDRVDPRTDVAVNAVKAVEPAFAEMECLGFSYYPLPGITVRNWLVNRPADPGEASILSDPRRLYVVAFLADPLPMIRAAGRTIEPFEIDGARYDRLVFGAYRVLKVAPAPPG